MESVCAFNGMIVGAGLMLMAFLLGRALLMIWRQW
jgi:hypothetical protein